MEAEGQSEQEKGVIEAVGREQHAGNQGGSVCVMPWRRSRIMTNSITDGDSKKTLS